MFFTKLITAQYTDSGTFPAANKVVSAQVHFTFYLANHNVAAHNKNHLFVEYFN